METHYKTLIYTQGNLMIWLRSHVHWISLPKASQVIAVKGEENVRIKATLPFSSFLRSLCANSLEPPDLARIKASSHHQKKHSLGKHYYITVALTIVKIFMLTFKLLAINVSLNCGHTLSELGNCISECIASICY